MAAKQQTYIVPSVGTKGKFTFKQPFDNEKYNGKEYEVSAIREIKELQDSGERPYESIYQIMSISQSDFEEDLEQRVPILVLTDPASKYLYVPADLVQGMPDVTGIKYQEIIIAASLGLVPYYENLDGEVLKKVRDEVVETIKDSYGVNTEVKEIRGSAIRYVTDAEHRKYKRLREKNQVDLFTYKSRYRQISSDYEALKKQYKSLESFLIKQIKNGTIKATQLEDPNEYDNQ